MNKVIVLVSLVAILGLAVLVAWQSRGAGADEPLRPGTMGFYRAQTATKAAEARRDIRLDCLAAHNAEYCDLLFGEDD